MELLKYFQITLLLFGFVESFRLDCEFDLVSPIVNSQRSKKEPSCSMKELKVLENETAVTEVSGNYLPEIKTNDDVKIFYIAVGINTEHVPTKVCNFFKNLELFVLSGHAIKRINREVFINCKKVWRVRISFTSLPNLPKDLFIDLIELDELWIFNNNKLVSLPADLLEKNTKLRELHLIDNPLSTIDAELPSLLTSIAISAAFGVCIDKIFPRDVSDLNLFLEEVAAKCESQTKKSYRLKTNELYKTLSEKEEKIAELKSSFDSCDRNLNAATNLLMSSKALQTCASIDVISRFSEHEKVVLLCESLDESSCVAIDMIVQFDNTRIDNSDTMRAPSKLKSLTILKQQILFLPANLGEMFSNLENLNVTYSGLFSIDNSCLSGLKNLLSSGDIHLINIRHSTFESVY